MTVETQTAKLTLPGDGNAFTFSFSPIVMNKSSEIVVTRFVESTGAETLLTEGTGSTNYAVNVSSFPGTGSITYPADEGTALPTTESLIVKRILVIEQTQDIENQGGYLPETLEQTLDRLVMVQLQQQELIDRCIKMQVSEATTVDMELPFLVASRFVRTNSAATGLELVELTSVTGALSSAVPSKVTLNTGSAGSSADIARADHAHQAVEQDVTAINVFLAANFI